MFNIIFVIIVFIGILTWILLRLNSWKQWVVLLLVLLVGIPVTLFFGFKWGWKTRENKLLDAQVECRKKEVIDELHLIFSGYKESDWASKCLTIHKTSKGKVLDVNQQQLKTTKMDKGRFSAVFYYKLPFRADDILEIDVGKKVYILTNFVLTAAANYNMGGPVLSGCRIDSADINGKRTAFYENMIIHKTDQF